MSNVLTAIRKVAHSNSTVLLTGDSGVGKSFLAKHIHDLSPRRAKKLILVNCAAIPQELAESKLFGHERGAFTGAISRKRGILEIAEGSTVLLDEIGALPLAVQSKLLTYLDTRSFSRVGGEQEELKSDVRLVAATNSNLEDEVRKGTFRHDLFHRLNVVSIHIPPLRERREDLLNIAQELLKDLSVNMGFDKLPVIEKQDQEILLGYSWPGNIRELRNILEKALLLSPEGRLSLRNAMPGRIVGINSTNPHNFFSNAAEDNWRVSGRFRKDESEGSLLAYVERSLIEQALTQANGVISQAARLLGISRSSLKTKRKTLGMTGRK